MAQKTDLIDAFDELHLVCHAGKQVGLNGCVATIKPTALHLAIKRLVRSSDWKQAPSLTTFHEYARMVGATLFVFANGPVPSRGFWLKYNLFC